MYQFPQQFVIVDWLLDYQEIHIIFAARDITDISVLKVELQTIDVMWNWDANAIIIRGLLRDCDGLFAAVDIIIRSLAQVWRFD